MTSILVDNNGKAILYGGKAIIATLPTGYTEVDGLTNSANTYLNTNIVPEMNDTVFEIKVKPSTGSWYIFQSREGSPIYGISGSTSGNTIVLAWAGSSIASTIKRNTSHTYIVKGTVKNGNLTLFVKDLSTGSTDTQTGTYTATTMNNKTYLWGNTTGGRVSANNTIYYAKMWKNGVCVMDYVPVVDSNNVAGFYDRVSGQFITVSAGSVTPGSIVP